MDVFVFRIKGSISVIDKGNVSQEIIDTVTIARVRDATLALDNFISYSEKDYSFSGNMKELKNGLDVSDWVRYSEDDGGNTLTVELIDVRQVAPIRTKTSGLVDAGKDFAEAVYANAKASAITR